MKNVVIIGAGGHAKVIADIVECAGDHVLGFLDGYIKEDTFLGKPVLGKDTDYEKYLDAYFIIGIGDAYARERFVNSMPEAKWYTAIHPKAVISTLDTSIGEGSVVMANAVINPCAHVGNHCIVNTTAVVEHDNQIDDFVHVSVGTKLAGKVTVGKRTWVGVGSAVSNGINICSDCMIGAGAVIVKDITEPGTYVGVPARKIK